MTTEEFKSNVEYVLKNCTFRDCDLTQIKLEIIKRIDCGELTIRLFQYRPAKDDIVNGLKSGMIHLGSPIRFNDPYDGLMRWNDKSVSELLNDSRYGNVLAKHFIIDSDTLAVSIRNRFRISCFSEIPDSPLMWAHYADNGRGFCVEYELSPHIGIPMCLENGQPCGIDRKCDPKTCGRFSKCSLAPVIYSTHRPDATSAMKQEIEWAVARELGTSYDLTEYDWLEPYRTVLFKSNDWAYEREWRMVLSDHQLDGYQDCQYPSGCLMRVILGPNMDPLKEYKVSKAVESYAKSEKRNVELSKVYVDVHSSDYKLNIRHERTIYGQ